MGSNTRFEILYLQSPMLFKQTIGSFLAIFLLLQPASGQDLTGIWKGYFITKDLSQYKVEFQIKQSSSSVKGVSYSYLTTVYYGKATMSGQWDKANKSLQIQELKTIEIKTEDGSVSCLMNYSLDYSRSGREEYLEGSFTSKHEFKSEGIEKGQDCGGGKVYLRRVSSSDFYSEPFLQNTTAKKIIINEAPVPRKANTVNNSPSKSEISSKDQGGAIVTSKKDTTSTIQNNTAAYSKSLSIPSVSNNRFNDLIQVITVKKPVVLVSLFDNGEIDGDTVTVYLNNKMALSKRRLSTTPLTLTLEMDDQNDIQELTMVADNLGKIPPNTALMIVEAGSQRFRVQLTSTEQKNAVVRFRYEK